jgi:P27 family predicted phage terminase small subunit
LTTAGQTFRSAYDEAYEAETPADTVILDRVCALLDQLERMEAQIGDEGLTVPGSKGQPTAHPLLAVVRGHSTEVARLVRALGLEEESPTTMRARAAADSRWRKR